MLQGESGGAQGVYCTLKNRVQMTSIRTSQLTHTTTTDDPPASLPGAAVCELWWVYRRDVYACMYVLCCCMDKTDMGSIKNIEKSKM